eukprot:NODE_4091_length_1232_cov_44.025248_g3595_i0.p1 GENE.NODE_4091_length_1232_cov_44.025248_g3595_i0~~NODE_4091_length_1232_cov_44.025248_g3595_i0.p1  ORF type:complete len:386 (+),score=52.35 NODE_4091_length_1232_cov_44.025248_g3595_i0:59-1159(+)
MFNLNCPDQLSHHITDVHEEDDYILPVRPNEIAKQNEIGNVVCQTGPSTLKIRICTWNVAECDASTVAELDLKVWLGFMSENISDVIVIGLQEVDMTAKAMVTLSAKADAWKTRLLATMSSYDLEYVTCQCMGGLFLLVCVHRHLHHAVDDIQVTSTPTGWGGLCGNKGGVVARLRIDSKYYCFVNSHLAAHQTKVKQRNIDYDCIKNGTIFPMRPFSILTHDYVFWFGDLNYRLDIHRDHLDKLLSQKDCDTLLDHDQLNREKALGRVFRFFSEGEIQWTPTYKFKSDMYDSRRSPAYCDRVLWYERHLAQNHLHCHSHIGPYQCSNCMSTATVRNNAYQSLREANDSDHKPVFATFHILDAVSV